jgi:hypothetical protein
LSISDYYYLADFEYKFDNRVAHYTRRNLIRE